MKQSCILSPFLFIMGIDWIMTQVTSNRRRWIRWTLDLTTQMSSRCSPLDTRTCRQRPTHWQLQQEDWASRSVPRRPDILRMSSRSREAIMLNGEAVEEVEHFTYLGSKVSTRRWRGRYPCSDFKGKSGFCISSEHLETQKHQPENQDPILQEQCLKHSIVAQNRGR